MLSLAMIVLTFQSVKSAASTLLSLCLHSSLMRPLKSDISVSLVGLILNVDESPSIRHRITRGGLSAIEDIDGQSGNQRVSEFEATTPIFMYRRCAGVRTRTCTLAISIMYMLACIGRCIDRARTKGDRDLLTYLTRGPRCRTDTPLIASKLCVRTGVRTCKEIVILRMTRSLKSSFL